MVRSRVILCGRMWMRAQGGRSRPRDGMGAEDDVRQIGLRKMGCSHGTHALLRLVGTLTLLGLALTAAACSIGGKSTAANSNTLDLNQVPWCDQPSINFQDDGKISHPVLTQWDSVKSQLGFTPYLPATLPKGTCLALAGGTIHDPIFGARLRITYVLPQAGPLSFSEAPKHGGQSGSVSDKVQCTQTAPGTSATATPGATPTPALTLCLGSITGTNVTVASAQTSPELEKLFGALQPNVDWVPQTAVQPQATPTT